MIELVVAAVIVLGLTVIAVLSYRRRFRYPPEPAHLESGEMREAIKSAIDKHR